ncbi:hypothetical protein Tco_0862053 [Tanacetum coccineum]
MHADHCPHTSLKRLTLVSYLPLDLELYYRWEWGRRGVKEKQHGSATVASPTSSQYGGLKKGNTVTSKSTGQVAEVTAAPSGTPDASTTLVNPGTPHEVVHESVMKEIFASYANKLSPTSSYARILIEIDACNGFSDNIVMAVPNLEGPGYTKETIRVEYEVDKGEGGSFRADDEGFIEAKKK